MAQDEAEEIAPRCDVMIVVGGRKSANSHRLVEVSSLHAPGHLVETAEELDPSWFSGDAVVGVTAGASTREQDVVDVIARIEAIGRGQGTGDRGQGRELAAPDPQPPTPDPLEEEVR
jgi:4-hydroxy-3-methylbut-2-enyl diphosphate reductase